MKMTLAFATIILCAYSAAFAGGGTRMNISTERKYVIGYTRGRYIFQNGKTIYIPGKPIFATRTTGFSVDIGSIAVKDHGITIKVAVKKVDAKDFVADAKGNTLALVKARKFTINGKPSKLLGKHEGRAYFRHSKSRKVISLALVKDTKTKTESSDG